MTTTSRRRRPVWEAYLRWLRGGWGPVAAGNLTALELSDRKLEPLDWTPEQITTFLWLRWLWESGATDR